MAGGEERLFLSRLGQRPEVIGHISLTLISCTSYLQQERHIRLISFPQQPPLDHDIWSQARQCLHQFVFRCLQLLIGYHTQRIHDNENPCRTILQRCSRTLSPIPPPTRHTPFITPHHLPFVGMFDDLLALLCHLEFLLSSRSYQERRTLVLVQILATHGNLILD